MNKLNATTIRALLTLPRDFGYRGDLPLTSRDGAPTWTLGPVIETRDSDALERSNARVLKRALENEGYSEGCDWQSTHAGHWAVGRVEHLSYRVLDSLCTVCDGRGQIWTPPQDGKWGFETECKACDGFGGALSEVAGFIHGWFDSLSDYPIADETDYYEVQAEEGAEYIGRHFAHLVSDSGLQEDWIGEVMSALESDDWTNENAVKDALEDLGYLRCDEDDALEDIGYPREL